MSQDIGPTPLGKAVMVLFILGCLVFAAFNFSPSLKNAIMGTGSGTGSGSGSRPSGPANTGSASGGAEPLKVEAPDTKGITTVQEYAYVPQEKLPPVKGVSGYEWDETRKTVEFPINVWIGWLPIVAANNGFAPNDESIFFKKYGFRVNLKLIDDPVVARDTYASGKSHVLWGTLDMMVLFAGELMKDSRTAPRIFQQIDWSSGGDGIVVRGNIRSVKDLQGKTVVYAQNSPSQYFINNLLVNAGLGPGKITHKFTSTAFEAAAAFVSDKSIDACVSWAPDIYTIPEKVAGTRVLTTTAEANRLIADVYAVRADFAKDHPEVVKGLVGGIFEGMALLKNGANKAKAFQWMADGYGMKVEDIKGMENDAHLTTFGENKEFFLNKNNPTNFERTWNNITAVYRELGLVGTPVRFDEVMDFSVIQGYDKEGAFKDQQEVAQSRFVPTTYKKVSAEAPVLTQTVRINFFPNSSNLYEPEHDEFGAAIPNSLYDPSVDATLEKVGRLVGQYERAMIGVVGHTDASMKGKVPEKAVKELSDARAQAVRDALVRKYKFPANKLIAIGKGWDEPADGADPANHALNRRVEIQVFTPEQ
ncbi:MAG: OmpA family protein [Candidatus Riflebacteria bacterium]|nr:OmpA family protein [Candidatus Riflebacteria bacterium]